MTCTICGRAGQEHPVWLQKLNKDPVDWSGAVPVLNGHGLTSALVIACERAECISKASERAAASCGPGWEVQR